MKKLFILISSLFLLTSCSSYINKIHQEIDAAEGGYRPSQQDQFDVYRQNAAQQPRRMASPGNVPSTSQVNKFYPSVKRQYMAQREIKKRFKADDLNDNSNTGSLWGGHPETRHLFTLNKHKRRGDIILLNVQSKLKDAITAELKRAFPERKKDEKEKKEGETAAAQQTAEGAGDANDKNKVHDKISTVVVEEINKDHLLIRGRKNVLYKNGKRLVEVQALVARRDISDEDAVQSANVLESNIAILR